MDDGISDSDKKHWIDNKVKDDYARALTHHTRHFSADLADLRPFHIGYKDYLSTGGQIEKTVLEAARMMVDVLPAMLESRVSTRSQKSADLLINAIENGFPAEESFASALQLLSEDREIQEGTERILGYLFAPRNSHLAMARRAASPIQSSQPKWSLKWQESVPNNRNNVQKKIEGKQETTPVHTTPISEEPVKRLILTMSSKVSTPAQHQESDEPSKFIKSASTVGSSPNTHSSRDSLLDSSISSITTTDDDPTTIKETQADHKDRKSYKIVLKYRPGRLLSQMVAEESSPVTDRRSSGRLRKPTSKAQEIPGFGICQPPRNNKSSTEAIIEFEESSKLPDTAFSNFKSPPHPETPSKEAVASPKISSTGSDNSRPAPINEDDDTIVIADVQDSPRRVLRRERKPTAKALEAKESEIETNEEKSPVRKRSASPVGPPVRKSARISSTDSRVSSNLPFSASFPEQVTDSKNENSIMADSLPKANQVTDTLPDNTDSHETTYARPNTRSAKKRATMEGTVKSDTDRLQQVTDHKHNKANSAQSCGLSCLSPVSRILVFAQLAAEYPDSKKTRDSKRATSFEEWLEAACTAHCECSRLKNTDYLEPDSAALEQALIPNTVLATPDSDPPLTSYQAMPNSQNIEDSPVVTSVSNNSSNREPKLGNHFTHNLINRSPSGTDLQQSPMHGTKTTDTFPGKDHSTIPISSNLRASGEPRDLMSVRQQARARGIAYTLAMNYDEIKSLIDADDRLKCEGHRSNPFAPLMKQNIEPFPSTTNGNRFVSIAPTPKFGESRYGNPLKRDRSYTFEFETGNDGASNKRARTSLPSTSTVGTNQRNSEKATHSHRDKRSPYVGANGPISWLDAIAKMLSAPHLVDQAMSASRPRSTPIVDSRKEFNSRKQSFSLVGKGKDISVGSSRLSSLSMPPPPRPKSSSTILTQTKTSPVSKSTTSPLLTPKLGTSTVSSQPHNTTVSLNLDG